MTLSRLTPLAALLAALPVLALEFEEPPPADGAADVRLWKEKCDLDGKGNGELLRVSGSSAAGSMSQGRETYRVQRGPDILVELTQEGRPRPGSGATIAEGERWTVTCSRNAVSVRAGDAELRLAVSGKSAAIDAKWLQGLTPEKGKGLALEKLEALSALLDGLEDEPAVGKADEAAARVGLLLSERALDAGDTDRADAALQQAEAGAYPALAAWSRKVAERLDAVRGAAPIQATKGARIGTVERAVTVPVGKAGEGEMGREPDVFWALAGLCVRQEGAQSRTMRCWDVTAAKWREPEPYASPWAAGPALRAQYLGNAGGYATRLSLQDSAGERSVGDFQSPSILARDTRGGLVIHSAGSASEKGDVSVVGYDAASGAGSVLAGGGKYFFDGPTSLRSVAQAGRSWNVAVPGRDTGVACVGEPLTSPDEKRAACLAGKAGEPKAGALELWEFELVEAGAGK